MNDLLVSEVSRLSDGYFYKNQSPLSTNVRPGKRSQSTRSLVIDASVDERF